MGQPKTDPQRIRGGLKFLRKADLTIYRAEGLLVTLAGGTPPPPSSLLSPHTFVVGIHQFHAHLTDAQIQYLENYTGSLSDLANAVARLVLRVDLGIAPAIECLQKVIAVPLRRGAGGGFTGGGLQPPPVGCCSYDDTMSSGIYQDVCMNGLQGTSWTSGDCPPIHPHGGKKPRRDRS